MRMYLTWKDVYDRLLRIPKLPCYGIPRGGAIVAGLTGRAVDKVTDSYIIVDDIYDTGFTAKLWQQKYDIPVFTLVNKIEENIPTETMIVFPWEVNDECLINYRKLSSDEIKLLV